MSTSSIIERSDDDLRAHLHGMWSGVAWAWAANAAFVDARGERVTERMLALAQPRPGERVLELACGAGDRAFRPRRWSAREGEVVLSDVSIEMRHRRGESG